MTVLSQEDSLKDLTVFLKVPGYSMELIKGDVSFNLGTWLANAFSLEIQDMGFLYASLNLKDITTVNSKINRENARVKVTTHHVSNRENIYTGVECRVDEDVIQYK